MFDPATLTLLAITDDLRDGREGLIGRAAAAVRGGATMIQLRLKDVDARTLVEVARAMLQVITVPVIVNDRADIALAAGAAGVHVGSGDLPVSAVRRISPPDFIIGYSVGSDDEVTGAIRADYVGIGPVYESASKSDAGSAIGVEAFARLARACDLPAVAIGGITAQTTPEIMAAGAAGVAVIRSLFGGDDPEARAQAIRSATGR